MQVFTQTITFTTALGVQTISDLAGNNYKCSQLFVEVNQANANVAAMIDTSVADTSASLGNQCIIKQFQIPKATSTFAHLDDFKMTDDKGANAIDLRQFAFAGTPGEKLRVTIHVS